MSHEEEDLRRDPRYARGIELFNRGNYYECHEVLEEIWTTARGPRRLLLQGLIHFAVAMHHHRRGNAAGALRQVGKGLKKLAGYLPRYAGLDTLALYRDGTRWRGALGAGEAVTAAPVMRAAQALQSQVQG